MRRRRSHRLMVVDSCPKSRSGAVGTCSLTQTHSRRCHGPRRPKQRLSPRIEHVHIVLRVPANGHIQRRRSRRLVVVERGHLDRGWVLLTSAITHLPSLAAQCTVEYESSHSRSSTIEHNLLHILHSQMRTVRLSRLIMTVRCDMPSADEHL